MILCALVLIYGIFFPSVNCEFGIAPHHKEPLTRLLKRTINHVKSFLGEFERKIKDSRFIVQEIHNQSLLNNNYSSTKHNIFFNKDTKLRAGEVEYNNANDDAVKEDGVKLEKEFIQSLTEYKSPNGSVIVAQRRATTIKPLSIFFRNIKRFNTEKDIHSRQDWVKNTLEKKIAEALPTTLGNKAIATSTKHRKRLMRQGPSRFQSQELYDSQGNPINPILFFKGFKFYNNITDHPKRLIGPTMFQSEEKLFTQRYIAIESNTPARNINITKPPNQITHIITKINQLKDKIDAKTKTPGKGNRQMVFRAIGTAKPTVKRIPTLLHTLSGFHFRLKENLLSEPTQEYPDIFLRGVEHKSTSIATRKSTTRYFPQLFTTETVTERIGGVIPELTKDYQNINFRAQSSDEESSPMALNLHKLTNYETLTEKETPKTKNLTPKNIDTTNDTDKLANENLRKIIAPSSYSDEETYLKVNLLDQLYHYNKTLHGSEVDKT